MLLDNFLSQGLIYSVAVVNAQIKNLIQGLFP